MIKEKPIPKRLQRNVSVFVCLVQCMPNECVNQCDASDVVSKPNFDFNYFLEISKSIRNEWMEWKVMNANANQASDV